MREKLTLAACVACVVCMSTVLARAGTISLVEDSLENLLGSGYTAATSLMTTDMSSGNLITEVYSQAFYDGSGLYAYVYQVNNIGVSGNSAAEMYTIGLFAGSAGYGDVGYLDGTLPGGFLAGGQDPYGSGFVDSLVSGLEISFYYSKLLSLEIRPGENSRVMFVLSELAPGEVIGSVIDGTTATGPVVGAVPEPGTIALLISGLIGAAFYIWRRKR
ncbi:MAG: PEP-CTERM sorting domain-containing protein [Pirellulales bacterium]|nr:PEP-CTERM sorting domain-containing protein [Pirellulales bacterium]